MEKITIDLNNPEFQHDLFKLQKIEQLAFVNTLKKISQLTWQQLYSDTGLKWEAITSKPTKNNIRLYSFRFSQKYRAVAYRENKFLRIQSLHVDHDSAYN